MSNTHIIWRSTRIGQNSGEMDMSDSSPNMSGEQIFEAYQVYQPKRRL
jgi:hypothetical protein